MAIKLWDEVWYLDELTHEVTYPYVVVGVVMRVKDGEEVPSYWCETPSNKYVEVYSDCLFKTYEDAIVGAKG